MSYKENLKKVDLANFLGLDETKVMDYIYSSISAVISNMTILVDSNGEEHYLDIVAIGEKEVIVKIREEIES